MTNGLKQIKPKFRLAVAELDRTADIAKQNLKYPPQKEAVFRKKVYKSCKHAIKALGQL